MDHIGSHFPALFMPVDEPPISRDNQSSHVTTSKRSYHSLDDDHISMTKEVCLRGHERRCPQSKPPLTANKENEMIPV